MSFKIASIKWPKHGRAANVLLGKLFIEVCESVGLQFSSLQHDPREIVRSYTQLATTSAEGKEYENRYKQLLDSEGLSRDFRSREATEIRIASLLVHINEENAEDLSEQWSWFIELLGYRRGNENAIIDMVIEYFSRDAQTNQVSK